MKKIAIGFLIGLFSGDLHGQKTPTQLVENWVNGAWMNIDNIQTAPMLDFNGGENNKSNPSSHKINCSNTQIVQFDQHNIPENIAFSNKSTLHKNNGIISYCDNSALGKKQTKSLKRISRVNISFGILGSVLNPNNTLESNMRKSGMTHTSYSNFLGSRTYTTHPRSSSNFIISDIDCGMFINPNHGVLFNFSVKKYSVTGFNSLGSWTGPLGLNGSSTGYYMHLKFQSNTFSLAYNYSINYQRANFSFGPSILFLESNFIIETPSRDNIQKVTKNKIGLFVGSSYNLLQKRNILLNVKTYYKWFPNISIGPHSFSDNRPDGSGSLTWQQVDLSMSSLNIGFGVGFRL